MKELILNYPPERTDVLIKRLLAMGYTQNRLATETGVSQPALSRMFSGSAMPSASSYHKLILFAASKLGDK